MTSQIATGNRTIISGQTEAGESLQEAYVGEGRLFTNSHVTGDYGVHDIVAANQMYSTSVEVNLATAAADNPAVLFKNPNGSGKTIYIWRIFCGVTIQNVSAEFRVWLSPTITANGTGLTLASRNVGGGAPASAANAYSLPSVSSNGTLAEGMYQGQNSNSIVLTMDSSLALAANTSMLITGNPLSNNRSAIITIIWYEV